MVACMVGAFMVAWTPYSALALLETFANDINSRYSDAADGGRIISITPAVATIPSLFAKTSVVFNPLVYGLLNTQVRRRLLKLERAVLLHLAFIAAVWVSCSSGRRGPSSGLSGLSC